MSSSIVLKVSYSEFPLVRQASVVLTTTDMPTTLPDSCDLAPIPLRDDPRDALVVKASLPYTSLQTLPEGAVVGTSSVRRSAQLRRLYPHLRFANLRGNVETRLAKVDNPESEYTCMVMSAAGLERIGLKHRITQYMGSKDGGILHAVGQGALGLEIRKGDSETLELVSNLADRWSTLACLAERALMRTLEGGCSVPIGVETEWVDRAQSILRITAIVVSLDGSQSVQDSIHVTVRTIEEAAALGQELAARLVKAGAGDILNAIIINRHVKD
jgi:hydroxymethylbilane synthase